MGEMAMKLNAGEVADGSGAKESAGSPRASIGGAVDDSHNGAEKSMNNLISLVRVKNKWVGGRRGADVRAATDMKVMVMNGAQMQWILEHDYGADGEVTNEIAGRKLQLQKTMSIDRR